MRERSAADVLGEIRVLSYGLRRKGFTTSWVLACKGDWWERIELYRFRAWKGPVGATSEQLALAAELTTLQMELAELRPRKTCLACGKPLEMRMEALR